MARPTRRPPADTGPPPRAGLDSLGGLRDAIRDRERQRAEAEAAARAQRVRVERERTEFRRAVADAVPLPPTGRVVPAPAAVAPIARQFEQDETRALAESLSDEIDVERLLDTDEALSFRRPGVGPDVPRRLRRGDWVIQREIDLHGFRVDEAREALAAFLADCGKREVRCVRIVHGKGLGSVNREPVLKGKVLRWLAQRDQVLAFCQAGPSDGGSGALVALLRPGPPLADRVSRRRG